MIGKSVFVLATIAVLLNETWMVLAEETADPDPYENVCYNCGYMEDKNGNKHRIPDMYEEIPFCDFDDTNSTMDIPTKPLFIVRA